MNKYIRLPIIGLLTFLIAFGQALADAPVIWNGTWAKNLAAQGVIAGTGQPLIYNGLKNYVGNNSGVNQSTTATPTGWGVSGATTMTSTNNPSFLPSANIGWALIVSNGAGAGYARYRFTVDQSDYGKVLLIQHEQTTLNGYSSAGSMSLDMYCTSVANYSSGLTRQSLSTDSSSVTKIPSLTGTFKSTFSAASGTPYCELRYTEVVADTSILALAHVYVGPSAAVQGANVGPVLSYTPTFAGLGTVTGTAVNYQIIGPTVRVWGNVAAGTPTAANATITLPNSYTAFVPNVTAQVQGQWSRNSGSTSFFKRGQFIVTQASNLIGFGVDEYTVAKSPFTIQLGNAIFDNGSQINFDVTVPVNELAGSGVVNLAQNDVEYLSNNSATTTSDSTSFAYGPSGSPVRAYAPAGTASVTKRVRASRPIQGKPVLQFQDATGLWVPSEQRIGGFVSNVGATTFYGFRVVPVNSTDVDVTFFSAYDSGGGAWSALAAAGWSWRVVVENPGQAIGFSAYNPGISAGLVPAVGLPGSTSGTAACTGCVGETISSISATYQFSASYAAITSITLTPGRWRVTGSAGIASAPTGRNNLDISVTGTSATIGALGTQRVIAGCSSGGVSYCSGQVQPLYITTASGQTLFLNGNTSTASSAATDYFNLTAERLP